MSRAKIIDHYIEKSKEPGFEIDTIRKELEAQGIDNEEIKIIVRLVDNEMQKNIITESNKSSGKSLMYVGLFLMGLSGLIYILSTMGLLGESISYVMMYGPFLLGVSLYLKGRLF